MNAYGLLPVCRHHQFGHSNSCSGFAVRWYLAERNEKVSPTRNNNVHSRCASHRSDIGLDDTFIQQLIQFSRCLKFRRCAYGDNLGSRIHGNCGSYPWLLAGCFLASASRCDNLLRKEENNARYTGTMVNSTCSRHHPVPENHAVILVGNLPIFKSGLFQAL